MSAGYIGVNAPGMPAEPGGGEAADPLTDTLPLMRALPVPAVLQRPDGTVVAASAVFEDMVGGTVDGMSIADLHALLEARFPTGRELSFADLCRDLTDRAGPEVGVVVVFIEVTRLIGASRGPGPTRG